jgi:membrane protein
MKALDLGGLRPLTLGKRAIKEFIDDDMATYAAALSYHALFALFPFVIFLISLLSFLRIPEFFNWILEQAQPVLPQDAYQRVVEVIGQIQNQDRGGLLSFGAITAIWAASSGMRALMNALNTAHDVEEGRPIWKQYLLSIGFTIGLAALMVTAVGLMVLGPQAIEWLADQAGLGSLFVTIWTWLRIPVAVVLLMMVAALIYYVAPNVEEPFALITPGAVVAVIVWVIASIGFSIYVTNFGNYSATYGSLGGIVVALFYFYISAAVLLLGAEINAEVHYARLGPPQPQEGGEAARQNS